MCGFGRVKFVILQWGGFENEHKTFALHQGTGNKVPCGKGLRRYMNGLWFHIEGSYDKMGVSSYVDINGLWTHNVESGQGIEYL